MVSTVSMCAMKVQKMLRNSITLPKNYFLKNMQLISSSTTVYSDFHSTTHYTCLLDQDSIDNHHTDASE